MVKEEFERKILRFLRLIKIDSTMDSVRDNLVGGADISEIIKAMGGPDNIPPEVIEGLEESVKKVSKLHKEVFSEDMTNEIMTFITEFYADHFTESEIDSLTEFFSSEAGKKYRQVESEMVPHLMAKVAEIVMSKVKPLLNDLTEGFKL